MSKELIKIVAGDKVVEIKASATRMMFNSFLSGVAWGFGSVFGASILVSILFLFLGSLDTAPIIGEYIANIINYIQSYTPNR